MRPQFVIALAFGLIALPLVATARPAHSGATTSVAGSATSFECRNNNAGS